MVENEREVTTIAGAGSNECSDVGDGTVGPVRSQHMSARGKYLTDSAKGPILTGFGMAVNETNKVKGVYSSLLETSV